ncbi:RAI1 like PD-XK nuclease-domain-containing protein [Infundibulicybe gibba]|nr:RAI1 like PD-XK nuclease-domain-containing protein [Infundibulicybe gibba]
MIESSNVPQSSSSHGDVDRAHQKPRLANSKHSDEETPLQNLAYPPLSTPPKKPTPFQQPTQVISFSYTPLRELEFTESALRYYVDPPRRARLGYGYERWVQRVEERGRIDGLLTAFSKTKNLGGVGDIGVVAWRGVMTKILISPYEEREGWMLNVMNINDTMYFEEHYSEVQLNDKNGTSPHHRRQMYFGYAFESYCTSATPTRPAAPTSGDPPGWGGDVDTNIQWCSVVKTKLGDTRILIGGEVDCIKGKYTGQPNNFVELKTSLVIQSPRDESRFEKKLLKFYFQSFLLGVPEIVVGFRTPSGEVQTVQTFKTIEIPRMVRGKPGAWDPLISLDWGSRFLTFLKEVVQGSPGDEARVWRVKFVPKVGVCVEILDQSGVDDVVNGEAELGSCRSGFG